jgi:hypothetical protein
MKQFIAFLRAFVPSWLLLVLLFAGCGSDTTCPPQTCPTCPAPEQPEFQFELTSWMEPDKFVIQGTSWLGEPTGLSASLNQELKIKNLEPGVPMLTLPASFKSELLKKNRPSYIIKMVESELQAEQTTQTDWAANSGALNVDYTPTPPTAGDVELLITGTPAVVTQTGYNDFRGLYGSFSVWQSFKQNQGAPRTLDKIKVVMSNGTSMTTARCEIWSASKATKISSSPSVVLPPESPQTPAWRTFYFSGDNLQIENNTEYWIRIEQTDPDLFSYVHYNTNTASYADGQFDWYSSVWNYNLGDVAFEASFLPIYAPSGYIQTRIMDLGSVPTVDGIWRFQNLTPSGTSVAYEAWALDALPGTSWTRVQRLGTETYVRSLADLGNGIVVAGTTGGNIYRSTDNSASWNFVQRLGTETDTFSLADLGGGIVVAGTYPTGQIYRSTDNGASWNLVQRLGTETAVYSLADLGGGIIVAGTTGGNVYRSTNNGASWNFVQRLGTETYVFSFADLGGGIVVAGTNPTGQIHRSTDSGASWTLVQRLGTETAVYSLADLGNNIVVAGTTGGNVYRSIDNGASWNFIQQLGTETEVRSLADLGNGIVVAGTTGGNVYRSIDNGASWNFIQQLGTETAVRFFAVLDGLKIIAGTGTTGQIYHGGIPIPLGAVVNDQAITVRSQYYVVKATLTADATQSQTPTVQSILARFPTYLGYSDNPRLGYEAALLSVSALSHQIDDFKPTSVGQMQAVLAFTPSVSNYLASAHPKNKEAKVYMGFVMDPSEDMLTALQQVFDVSSLNDMLTVYDSLADVQTIYDVPGGLGELDYLLYYTGVIKDWAIGENDQVTLKIDDLHIEWDAPVPRTSNDPTTGLPVVKTWLAMHPVDVIIDIVQGYVTSTRSDGTLLRGYTSLDYNSLATVKAATPGWVVTRKISEKTEKAKDLLEELRQLLSAYYLPKGTGNVFLKRFSAAEAAVMTLTDRDFLTKKWDSNSASLINLFVTYFKPTWYAARAYLQGEFVIPTLNNQNGFQYECTVAGTSHASTEPTWPVTVGGTVVDGTATWTCRQANQDNELKNYVASSVTTDETSIENWDEVSVKSVKDPWTQAAQLSQIQDRGNMVVARYGSPAEKLSVSVDMRFFELETGDIVNVTTERAPSPDLFVTLRQVYDISCLDEMLQVHDSIADVREIHSLSADGLGIVDKPFQVVKKAPDFKSYKINFELLRV